MAQLLYSEWFALPFVASLSAVALAKEGAKEGELPDGWEVRNVESLIKRIPVGKKYENKNVFKTGKVPVLDQGKSGFRFYAEGDSPPKSGDGRPCWIRTRGWFFENGTILINLLK